VLAAVTLLRGDAPDLRIRFVNVVDLMVLQPQSDHPHEDREFDALFTTDRPVIFAFHGYPTMIHKLTYRRHNHDLSTCAVIAKRGRRPPLRHSRAQ
jgi:xylulose-5-phosphate/fructose-6-phosphate phosphoketolase